MCGVRDFVYNTKLIDETIMLTKKTIEKLYAAPIEVKLWNGNFNVANVEITNNKKRYQLRYELSHPLLEQFSGKRGKAEFVIWDGCRGVHETVPEELRELVKAMRKAAEMDIETVATAYERNTAAVKEFREAFLLYY